MKRPRIASVGYQRLAPVDLVEWLQAIGINCVVDVRWTPFSFKRGWSKGPLQKTLEANGIEYRSERVLGSPAAIRTRLRQTGDFAAFAGAWEIRLSEPAVEAALDIVWQLACSRGVALLCLEDDPEICHRSILVNALEARAESVETLHYA